MKKNKDILKIAWAIVKIFFVMMFSVGGAFVVLIAFVAWVFFCGVHFDEVNARREGHVKWNDPCFKSYYAEKGPVYEIKGERVCMEFKRGANNTYSKTLEGADPETFHQIDFYYFADKNHVYYGNKIIEGVDPNNFNPIDKNAGYFTDGKDIYYDGKKIDADINSFTIIKNKKGYFSGYAKDKNHVWKYGKKLEGVNPNSFILPLDN